MTTPPDDTEPALLAELGERHGLWPANAAPAVVSRGGENTTFAVGGFIVRCSQDRDAMAREVALLHALAGATTVATPIPLLHEAELGVLVYRRLPGEPLLRRRHRGGSRIAAAIAEVLQALRRCADPLPLPLDDYGHDDWHADALEHLDAVRAHLGARREAIVAGFLDDPIPPATARRAPQHNDLGAEHILVDDAGAVVGVIDWTDAARADSARDPGLLYRDLGADAAFEVATSLDGPLTDDDRDRIRFHARCKWLEDYRFALEDPSARAPYLANAEDTFAHTFARSS